MTIKFTRRRIIACVAVLAAAVLVPIALHAASSAGTLEACINPGNGMMRLVDSSTACHNNETRVTWNIEGPPGPKGDPGDPGPPGPSSGGPPFVWVCTPARFSNAGSNGPAELYVFNGGDDTANVSVNFLDKGGSNLAGHAIPGSPSPGNYPGEANGVTVPLAVATTRDLYWMMPVAAGGGFDGLTDVSFSIRVVSDQPIVVGARFDYHPFEMPQVCHPLPK